VVWFGIIAAGGLVLSYVAAGVVARALDVGNPAVAARLLLVLDFLTIVGMFAFALAGSFALALGAFWFATLVRRVAEPVYLTWLNQGLDPAVRATVISMSSQAGALGEASAGPVRPDPLPNPPALRTRHKTRRRRARVEGQDPRKVAVFEGHFARRKRNPVNPDEIYRNFVDVWHSGA
jgi:hypothetical protein